MTDAERILAALDEPPDSAIEPPVDTAAQELPFKKLRWQDFEKLCSRLARLEGSPEHAQRFGTSGQAQSGIDIYCRLTDGQYVAYQCKKYESLGPADIKNAVDEFLDPTKGGGSPASSKPTRAKPERTLWAKRAFRFVLCTSDSAVATERALAIEKQAKRLREHVPPIEFVVWDAEQLSARLKNHPNLVRDFFGRGWYDLFARPTDEESVGDQVAAIRETLASFSQGLRERVRIVTLDWAPARLQQALTELAANDAEFFARLSDRLGTPPRAPLVVATVDDPDEWLLGADGDVWTVVARIAESLGEWPTASRAWELAAERQTGDDAGDSIVSAAVAAQVADDDPRYGELLARVRSKWPHLPRLALQELPDDDDPTETLDVLDRLVPRTDDDTTLIAGHQALACLMLPDVERARGYLADAVRRNSESSIVRAVQVNVVVQEGRLAVIAGQQLDQSALRRASVDALELRGRMMSERRWEESARLLMLAADARSLLLERKEASELLSNAVPEERTTPRRRVVLADSAASRALDFKLALQILGDHPPTLADERRIRAEAMEAVGTAAERTTGLTTLEALVAEAGPEAPEAAFCRLAATFGQRRVPWHEGSEKCLMQRGHERAAITAKVFYFADQHADFDAGDALLRPHLTETWAKITRLRLAIQRGKHSLIQEAADAVMAIGPSPANRLEAGRGYSIVGDYQRAHEVLIALARDNGAPPRLRGEAFRLLLRIVAEKWDDWRAADMLQREWAAVLPGSPIASMWAPTIANRLRTS